MGSKVKTKGFEKLRRVFNKKRMNTALVENQKKTMRTAVLLLRTEIIKYIDTEKHGIPNSPLTILIKGSSRPLVDHGDLRQGITTAVDVFGNKVKGAVGVLKKAQSRGVGGKFKKITNVASALHEGFTVKVTPEVRRAVFAEMSKRRGRKVKVPAGGGSGSKSWRVRGRPFIREPFESNEQRIVEILGSGVRKTIRGLGKK